MPPNIIGIIPARMASSRFPGKPLADINGVPMLGHVYFRSKMSELLREVYVATCDEVIADYVRGIGGIPIMTAASHQRASDRTAEALTHIEAATGQQVDIVVMIQGDEPMLRPAMIDEALAPMLGDPSPCVVNLMARLKTAEEQADPNEIKVVVGRDGYALYFSRQPIPTCRDGATVPMFKQVCIIPFQRDFLMTFNALEPTALEIAESIDMLRVLEHGYRVRMVRTQYEVYSVDTPADRDKVAGLMADDDLTAQYQERA